MEADSEESSPPGWIEIAAGLAFIGFGIWTLRGDSLEDNTCSNIKCRSPFLCVATTFFLAELGDKTMLSTVAIAANYPAELFWVWIGSSLGMVVSDGLAILVGVILGKSLPERAVKIGASLVFFGFGIWNVLRGVSIVQTVVKLPPCTWVVLTLLVAAFVISKMSRPRKLAESVTKTPE